MDYEKIYEESKLDAALQSVEDGLPVREGRNETSHFIEMARVNVTGVLDTINGGQQIGSDSTKEEIEAKIKELLEKEGNKDGYPLTPYFSMKDMRLEGVKQINFNPNGQAYLSFADNKTQKSFQNAWYNSIYASISKEPLNNS